MRGAFCCVQSPAAVCQHIIRNILKSRIKWSSLLGKISAWWWFQGEQPGHSAWVLGSVIDAGVLVCGCVRRVPMPTVTRMTCASFTLINVIPFFCSFIPKSSLVLQHLQQFSSLWAVGGTEHIQSLAFALPWLHFTRGFCLSGPSRAGSCLSWSWPWCQPCKILQIYGLWV